MMRGQPPAPKFFS